MKKILYHFLIAGIAASAFFACVDTHDTLPYVDPNTQYKQDQENSQILEEGTFISEKFSSSLGGCVSVSDNTTVNYIIDYSSAKVTGNINSAKNAATVYLVSPTVDLSSAESAYYTFEHIIAYETGDLLQDEQFLVSLDYNGDPAKATWTQLPVSAVLNTGKPASWSEFVSTAFNLPQEYLKSSVTFAFKYTSTTSCAATWEIKNFSVKTGTVTETVPYENPKVQETSPEEPLTVTEALTAVTSATAKSYVTGYIVGFVDGQKLAEGAVFSAENCKVESNILIAASATEKDVKNCLPVQLPANTKHRTALNLSSNKDVLGKQVVLGGYIQSYFGVNGLKSLFYSALEGVVIDAPAESTGFDGNDNTTELTETINLSFKESGLDKFSIYNFAKAEDLGHVWTNSSQYGMVAKGSAAENKAWLISPRVDVSKCEKIEFTFNHAANNFPEAEGVDKKCAVYVSKDYAGGDPSKATWTKLDLEKWSSNWTWVENTFDLTEYKSDNVHIAFEYTSAAQDGEKTGSFEIDKVYLGATRAAETPVKGYNGESTQKEAAIPFEYDFKTQQKLGDFLVYDAVRYALQDEHIWKTTQYGATAVANKEAESWLISPKFSLESGKKYSLTFTNWYKNAAKPAEAYKAFVSEDFSGDVSKAKWTALNMTFGEASKNNDVELDLSTYAGKKVTVAFKYTATNDEKGTFEVIKFAVKEVVENEEPVKGFDGESTLKTAAIPFSYDFQTEKKLGDFLVYDVKRFKSKDTHIWTADTKYGAKAVATKEAESWFISPKFSLESGKEYELKFTNSYLNADKPAEVFKAYVLENFSDDPTKATKEALTMEFAEATKNKENTVDLSKYAGKSIVIAFQYSASETEKGTFEVLKFSLTEVVENEDPVAGFDGNSTVETKDLPFEIDFTQNTLGGFLVYDVKRFNSQDEHIWKATADGATATANKASESWFISPKFALKSDKGCKLTFTIFTDKAANDAKAIYQAYIWEDYNGGKPSDMASTAKQLTLSLAKNSNKENEIDLSSYAGKNITIAFKYTSTDEDKGKLRFRKFKLEEVESVQPITDQLESDNNLSEQVSVPYEETFAESIGKFTAYCVTKNGNLTESKIWNLGSSCMKASAYVNSKNYESESWLISPEIDLSGNFENPTLTFSQSGANFETNVQTSCKVLILTDYVSGNPKTASKVEPEISEWPTSSSFIKTTINLTAYKGQKIRIAFKYTSNSIKAGTWQIKNFKVSGEEPVITDITSKYDSEDKTATTKTIPYEESFGSSLGNFTAYTVSRNGEINTGIWNFVSNNLQGTAYINSTKYKSEGLAISPAIQLSDAEKILLTFNNSTNYFGSNASDYCSVEISENYSNNPETATWTVLAVENWTSNIEIDLSAYKGKTVHIAFRYKSTAETSGTWKITNFKVAEKANNEVELLNETLISGLGNFKTKVTKNPDGITPYSTTQSGERVTGTRKKSGETGPHETEGYLYSPVIDLSNVTSATLTFSHSCYKFVSNIETYCKVLISTDFNGSEPAEATWTELTLSWPTSTGTSSTFTDVNIDISSYAGQSNVYIAYYYSSTSTDAGTWEVKNVKVVGLKSSK